MPILSRSDKKSSCLKYNEELENLKSLTITSADTCSGSDKLKNFARYCKNLESVIFKECGDVKYEILGELFRRNPKIKKVMFVDCRPFGKNAFESFRHLDKSLKELDLTGYKITNDEMKSLLRANLTNMKSITFSNRCDVCDLIKKFYPHCVINGLDKKDKDGKMSSSKSDFEIHSNQDHIRRHIRPRTTADHHDHLSDSYDVVDYGNYARRHDLMKNSMNPSDRRLSASHSKKDLHMHRNHSSDSSSDDSKYIPKIPYEESSSSESSSDTDYEMKKSPLSKKPYDKYERRK